MRIVFFILSMLTISQLHASSFMGSYKCSGGYKKFIVGEMSIAEGLIYFDGKKVRTKDLYRAELIEECKASYKVSVSCDEESNFYEYGIYELPRECVLGDPYDTVDITVEREWNVVEVFLSDESEGAICSNVPSLKKYQDKKIFAKKVFESSGISKVGETGRYDITSDKCIIINF